MAIASAWSGPSELHRLKPSNISNAARLPATIDLAPHHLGNAYGQ
jgi:hypothetical protein